MWKPIRNHETRGQRANCARMRPCAASELSLDCVWTPRRLENAGKAEKALRPLFCPERVRKAPLSFLVGPESGFAARGQLPEQASGWYVAVNAVSLNCDLKPNAAPRSLFRWSWVRAAVRRVRALRNKIRGDFSAPLKCTWRIHFRRLPV